MGIELIDDFEAASLCTCRGFYQTLTCRNRAMAVAIQMERHEVPRRSGFRLAPDDSFVFHP